MRIWMFVGCFFWLACGSEPTETTVTKNTFDTATTKAPPSISSDTANAAKDTAGTPTPVAETIRKPSGIYEFYLPYDNNTKILHTIAFYPTTFRLQEEYPGKKDSVVVTEGSWAPSQGYIWLYKDQVVQGRYTWNGNTLEYFSPRWKKNFPLTKLTPVTTSSPWQAKKKEGAVLFAVGTEPFWIIEINRQDSIVLSMPSWTEPLRVKLANTTKLKDSTVYTSVGDSLRVTLYRFFCNDGMSDFLYSNKVKVHYRGQTLEGCGEVF